MNNKIDFKKKRRELSSAILKAIKDLMRNNQLTFIDLAEYANCASLDRTGYVIRCVDNHIEEITVTALMLEDGVLYYQTQRNGDKDKWENLGSDVLLDNLDQLYDVVFRKVSTILEEQKMTKDNMPGEIWKEIEGCEGRYQISNMGRVRSIMFNNVRYLKIRSHKRSIFVEFQKAGKDTIFVIGKEVANYFLPNPNNYKFIRHIDNDPFNNKVSNLMWVKSSSRGGLAKPVIQLTQEGHPIKIYSSASEASKVMGCSVSSITKCCQDLKKDFNGYKWMLKEDFDALDK